VALNIGQSELQVFHGGLLQSPTKMKQKKQGSTTGPSSFARLPQPPPWPPPETSAVASTATSAVASAPAQWLNALQPTGPVAQRPAAHRPRGSTPCSSVAAPWLQALPPSDFPWLNALRPSDFPWLNVLWLNGYPVAQRPAA
jgi:hypothetical protein